MGASSSSQSNPTMPGTNHSQLPEDHVPYTGPAHEYRVVQVQSKLKATASFGFSAGQQVAQSDISSYYGTLMQQYAEYYHMNTFFQVPLSQQQKGFSSAFILFQGIFSRPTIYTPSEEKWQLKVEQSAIQVSILRSGSLFTIGQPILDENMGDIFNKIATNTQIGGKLVCMECSGNITSQGMSFTKSPFYGCDIFFDMPMHPNPTLYTYTAYSTPMNVVRNYGSIEIQCDFQGTLKLHLDQGWKLVDIFIAQHESGMNNTRNNQHHYRQQTMNTVWFFEKELNSAADLRPRYQVTMVEYYMPFSASFGGVKSNLDLGPLLTEMGRRGWELVCALDTPQTRQSGFAAGTRGVVIFFQRPILITAQSTSHVAGPTSIGFEAPPNAPPAYDSVKQ